MNARAIATELRQLCREFGLPPKGLRARLLTLADEIAADQADPPAETPDARLSGLATSFDISDVMFFADELRKTNRPMSDALWRVARSADHYFAATGRVDESQRRRVGGGPWGKDI